MALGGKWALIESLYIYCTIYTRNWGYSPDPHVAYSTVKEGEKQTDNKTSGSDACNEEKKAECKGLECLRDMNVGVIFR